MPRDAVTNRSPAQTLAKALLWALCSVAPAHPLTAADTGGPYDFPIYRNNPLGRQVSGQHAPATTDPLTPEQAEKRFTLPPGFEIRLFAAEPEVVNPVAMTWDARGRLWVLELYEYPQGAPPDRPPRDRIKILEDTDADGRADRVHVWADELNLATGLILGNGGAYVGQAPHLLFLEDTDGDDRADKRSVVMSGFGLEDRHELLNGFAWGPDGQLYMTHGVFTHSKVKAPGDPDGEPVIMNAAVARWNPKNNDFEVFADGTSNPWGVDFDRYGNAFVSACVIDHLFHMAPGGIYVRQAGQPTFPYAYELLPSIVDHRHHMAAYCGVQVYQGDQFPDEHRGTIVMGNIHDNAVHQDRLAERGSSFTASFVQDLVRSNDGWFRPVSEQVGPDGALWIADWYDRYPCYQNARADPDGVDREYGRVWRLVFTGHETGTAVASRPSVVMDLTQLASSQLVSLLGHDNVWQRRTARRLLAERGDRAVQERLLKQTISAAALETRLESLWTLHQCDWVSEELLDQLAADSMPALRAWAARLTGERGSAWTYARERLLRLAQDREPTVRFATAVALRQFVSGSLTVNSVPRSTPRPGFDPQNLLTTLIESSGNEPDPLIPFMIWMAAEPIVVQDPRDLLEWLANHGEAHMPVSGMIAGKTLRRLCDLRETRALDEAVRFLSRITASPRLAAASIDGLLKSQSGQPLLPSLSTEPLLEKLRASSDIELREKAQQLGTLWGDAAAVISTIEALSDANASVTEKQRAVAAARRSLDAAGIREALLNLVASETPDELRADVIRAVAEIPGAAVDRALLQTWPNLPIAQRRLSAEVLASRNSGRTVLLDGIEEGRIQAGDLPVTAIRTLMHSQDEDAAERVRELIGRFREPDVDQVKRIAEKRRVVLQGAPDLEAGREVARQACLVCHKLHGEGADVGPDLTGVGRSSLDALLANIIDPNLVIGNGYENVIVETEDERTLSGRLVEDSENRVRLLASGPVEHVIPRSEIVSIRTSELSVMPEGLEQMPDEDFRNMVWFILNPPEDNLPLTDERRRQLIGSAGAMQTHLIDGESVAHWNPEWEVIAPAFEGTPRKLTDYHGRNNVLETHPFSESRPAVLQRLYRVPSDQKTYLEVLAAAHDRGDWELRVRVDDTRVAVQKVNAKPRWHQIRVDLTPWAGKTVLVQLENAANGWSWEFGYWGQVTIHHATSAAARHPAVRD